MIYFSIWTFTSVHEHNTVHELRGVKILTQERKYSVQSRSIETYDMRYFPQHVLLCTSNVHDQ